MSAASASRTTSQLADHYLLEFERNATLSWQHGRGRPEAPADRRMSSKEAGAKRVTRAADAGEIGRLRVRRSRHERVETDSPNTSCSRRRLSRTSWWLSMHRTREQVSEMSSALHRAPHQEENYEAMS